MNSPEGGRVDFVPGMDAAEKSRIAGITGRQDCRDTHGGAAGPTNITPTQEDAVTWA